MLVPLLIKLSPKVRILTSGIKRMPQSKYQSPYDDAKEMLLVENVDDRAFLKELLEAIYPELPQPEKKKISDTWFC